MFVIQAANLPVSAKIYAAVDATGGLCWTDDLRAARRFGCQSAAKQFGQNHIVGDDWVIQTP